ncbi:hypothetical protein, partial [Vibrio sp. D406a]|uniref:hypothetical protein n=1 Tax=Vibrio sp. D406a TaxID=2836435 RepID=UPI002557C549
IPYFLEIRYQIVLQTFHRTVLRHDVDEQQTKQNKQCWPPGFSFIFTFSKSEDKSGRLLIKASDTTAEW